MSVRAKYITMIVNDTEESVKFYTETLGFCQKSVYRPAPGVTITLLKGSSETMLELIECKKFAVGLYSVGMDVDDLDETTAQLAKKGIKLIAPVTPTLVGRMTFVEDPNGVRIALIEHNMKYALQTPVL